MKKKGLDSPPTRKSETLPPDVRKIEAMEQKNIDEKIASQRAGKEIFAEEVGDDPDVKEMLTAIRKRAESKEQAIDDFVSKYPDKARMYAARWDELVAIHPEIAHLPFLPEDGYDGETIFSWENRTGIFLPPANDLSIARDIADALRKSDEHTQEQGPPKTEEAPVVSTVEPGAEEGEEIIISPQAEGTPKEWRDRLRQLIEKAQGRFGMNGRGEQLKSYFTGRSESLNEKAKEYGPKIATFIRSGIEKYNKLHWAKKLFVTGSLVAGVSLTSAVAPLISGILTAALYGQRVVGGIGFAENQRKSLDKKIAESPEHWFANKSELLKNSYAIAVAAVYMGGTMFAVREGVEALNALGLNEWLSNMFNSHKDALTQPEVTPIPDSVKTILQPADTIPSPSVLEMPSVEASAGHGYEYMVKRLWESLHEKGIAFPENIDPNSDLAKLLNADNDSIDRVVHQIASDPQHGFFNADGTSVLIDPSAHLTIVDGQLHFTDATHPDMVHAAENMGTTPAYHPETSVPVETVPTQPSPAEAEAAPPITPPTEQALSPAPIEHLATQAPAPVIEHGFITNKFNVIVPVGEPHVYTDHGAEHLLVYGGSPLERAQVIQEHLNKNPSSVVFSADDSGKYRIPWHLVEGKATPETPVQTRGFLGFFKSFMKAPAPDEFEKLIK